MRKALNFLQNLIKALKPSSSRDGENEEDLDKIAAQERKLFPYEALLAATRRFHPNNKLGDGDYGSAYRGKLEDGRDIVVKKLSNLFINQGNIDFTNNAKSLTRLQHRNVVNLLGYSIHDEEKFLVYEYVSNESLDKHLFGSRIARDFDWKRRHDLINGIARGLRYLHEGLNNMVIHHDIKATNILIDGNWVPKIADFGMSHFFYKDQTSSKTRAEGTNGYMAPEYLMYGVLSPKIDVFGFGVLVLELISGRRNSYSGHHGNEQSLLEWVYELYKQKKSLEIMDPMIATSANPEQVQVYVQIGLLCTQGDPNLRPTMQDVVVMLSKKLDQLEKPTRPARPGSRYRVARRRVDASTTSQSSDQTDSITCNIRVFNDKSSANRSDQAGDG